MPRKNATPLPSQDDLKRMFEYHEDTGVLLWKARTVDMFTATNGRSAEHSCAQWNSRWAGKPALNKPLDGYLCGSLNYKATAAHRVIWKLITGEDPYVIDHINGIRDDNRIINLRNVDYSVNGRNRAVGKNSKSGVMGVHFNKRQQKWTAYLTIGTFVTKEEAIEARKNAESLLGFHSNNGRVAA